MGAAVQVTQLVECGPEESDADSSILSLDTAPMRVETADVTVTVVPMSYAHRYEPMRRCTNTREGGRPTRPEGRT